MMGLTTVFVVQKLRFDHGRGGYWNTPDGIGTGLRELGEAYELQSRGPNHPSSTETCPMKSAIGLSLVLSLVCTFAVADEPEAGTTLT